MRRNLSFHARFKSKHISTNLRTVAVVKRLPSLFLFSMSSNGLKSLMKLLPGSLVCIIFSIKKSVNDRKYAGIDYIIGRFLDLAKRKTYYC